jgi:hypothetical protein
VSDVTCAVCAHPIRHEQAYVCERCGDRLARDLAGLSLIAGEHVVTITRQARVGSGGGKGAETPLPWNLDAANALDAGVNTLTTWARHCAQERGLTIPPVPGPIIGPTCWGRPGRRCGHRTCRRIGRRAGIHPMTHVAAWLVTQVTWLRHRPEAVEAWDELGDAVRVLVRVVDQPQPMVYLGPCTGCAADLYARSRAETVACRECGTGHDAAELRESLLDEAAELLATASEAARAVTALGYPITPSMVWGYAHRGRLEAHATDVRGRPVYRVGDVWALAIEAEQRRAVAALGAA